MTPLARGAVLRAPARPADLAALCGSGGVLVIAPHPDDESLGMGGAIAMAAAAGRGVQIVALTGGNRSHTSARVPPAALARLRARELREAARHLGAPPPVMLGHDDQAAPEAPSPDEIARLAAQADGIRATAIWTCWRHDPHPDHQRGARYAERLAAALALPRPVEVPVWGRFTETPPGRPVLRLAAPAWALQRKAQAIAAHCSQMTPLIPDDPAGFIMDPATRAHFEAEPELFLP